MSERNYFEDIPRGSGEEYEQRFRDESDHDFHDGEEGEEMELDYREVDQEMPLYDGESEWSEGDLNEPDPDEVTVYSLGRGQYVPRDIAFRRWILQMPNANVRPGETGMEALVRNVQEITKHQLEWGLKLELHDFLIFLEAQFNAKYEMMGAVEEELAKGCDRRYVKTENGIEFEGLPLNPLDYPCLTMLENRRELVSKTRNTFIDLEKSSAENHAFLLVQMEKWKDARDKISEAVEEFTERLEEGFAEVWELQPEEEFECTPLREFEEEVGIMTFVPPDHIHGR